VDFQAIADARCRRAFQEIATSWTLPEAEIDALYEVVPPLLAGAPDWDRMLDALDADSPARPGALARACRTLAAASADAAAE
jgi:hypothetical protein